LTLMQARVRKNRNEEEENPGSGFLEPSPEAQEQMKFIQSRNNGLMDFSIALQNLAAIWRSFLGIQKEGEMPEADVENITTIVEGLGKKWNSRICSLRGR